MASDRRKQCRKLAAVKRVLRTGREAGTRSPHAICQTDIAHRVFVGENADLNRLLLLMQTVPWTFPFSSFLSSSFCFNFYVSTRQSIVFSGLIFSL